MTPPIVHVESDFASPDETLVQYRHRTCPAADKVAIALIPLGIVGVILLAFVAAALIATAAP